MLAMPISSSGVSQQPALQFTGPSSTKSSSGLFSSSSSSDTGGTIYLRDPRTGQLNPTFSVQFSKSKPNVTLSKIMPDGSLQVIGTSEKSEMSGKFKFSLQGQEAEMKYNTMGTRRLAIPALGDFEIEDGLSGASVTFVDSQKIKVAKCDWKHDEPTLDIYVQGAGDFLIEMMVLGGMALMYSGKRETKQMTAGLKVVNALVGMPGVGS